MNRNPYIVLLALVLTSCDTFYAIRREADITAYPDLQQVKVAMSAVDGVSRVTYRRYDGAGPSHVFFYSGANEISGRVTLATDKAGRRSITVGFIRSNVIPSQEVIDRNYTMMLKVEEAIKKRCALPGRSIAFKETSSPEMKHRNAQPTSGGDSSTRADAGLGTP